MTLLIWKTRLSIGNNNTLLTLYVIILSRQEIFIVNNFYCTLLIRDLSLELIFIDKIYLTSLIYKIYPTSPIHYSSLHQFTYNRKFRQ